MSLVLVENEYYDGPRVGITLINRAAYRFVADFEPDKGYLETFTLYPISESEVELELEQWRIFVDWNNKYEAGTVSTETHPGHGGISSRWDEIELLLEESRKNKSVPSSRATAEFIGNGQEKRYEYNGPSYSVTWALL